MLLKRYKAQSFIEFALVLPILILVVLGVVELTLYIGTYINLVDLTREAARFASQRDPFDTSMDLNKTSCDDPNYNFYIDSACFFSQLKTSPPNPTCPDAKFCNGFNSTVPLKSNEDDILITVWTVSGNVVTDQNPANPPWVWSNNRGFDTSHQNNWRRNCDKNAAPDPNVQRFFTKTKMDQYMAGSGSIPTKGLVTVEVVYCYHQALNIPILSQFLPNPIMIHTYTIMPLPAAQPTPTPPNP